TSSLLSSLVCFPPIVYVLTRLFFTIRRSSRLALFPYTTLFRSGPDLREASRAGLVEPRDVGLRARVVAEVDHRPHPGHRVHEPRSEEHTSNSSHVAISYADFCLKKKRDGNRDFRQRVDFLNMYF